MSFSLKNKQNLPNGVSKIILFQTENKIIFTVNLFFSGKKKDFRIIRYLDWKQDKKMNKSIFCSV